jgi:hypothetical protein
MNMKLSDFRLLDLGNSIQMVGAIYSDGKENFVTLFPEDHDAKALPHNHLEMDHEEWKTFLRQTDLLEVEILTKTSDGTMAKAIVRKSARQIEQAVSWNVYRRDSYSCRYCGNDKVPLTVDHLVRWEEYGPSIEANLVAACRKCNKTRGDMSYEDWLRHEFYLRVSARLRPEVRAANEALLPTLANIPRVKNLKSR